MTKQNKGYAINLEKFKKAYARKHNEPEPTIYEIAELLGVTYQTVKTLDKKPIAGLNHLKILSVLTGLDVKELMIKVEK